MRTTSSKAPKHAHASRYANEIRAGQPSYSNESETAEPRRSRRSRRARLFTIIMLPTTALLITLVLAAVHVAGSKKPASHIAIEAVGAPPILAPTGSPSPSPSSSPSRRPTKPAKSSTATGPSGAAMPTGNLPGWHLTYSQDFNGPSLPPGWGAYTGEPGGDPEGYWDPANVSVSGGELHFRTTANDDPNEAGASSTGGAAFYGNPQTYGMYLVRLKGDYEPSLNISDIALLWPNGNNIWPPEIDFFEDSGSDRSDYSANLHAGPDGDDCCIVRQYNKGVGTQWHTYGIEWTPTTITYTIDGKPWGSVINSDEISSPAQWPNIGMNLDLQSQNLGSAQPSGSIETMTVAWVVEYALDS
jgi:hypothetical protein